MRFPQEVYNFTAFGNILRNDRPRKQRKNVLAMRLLMAFLLPDAHHQVSCGVAEGYH
jgi:hypothetical protein